MKGHAEYEKLIGKSYNNKGYLSTSTSTEIAKTFAKNNAVTDDGKRVFIQFDIPEGKGVGMYVGGISSVLGEDEFLIKNNSNFKVYDVGYFNNAILVKARYEK